VVWESKETKDLGNPTFPPLQRPNLGRGNSGREIAVDTNCFKLKVNEEDLMQYAVAFEPIMKHREETRQLFEYNMPNSMRQEGTVYDAGALAWSRADTSTKHIRGVLYPPANFTTWSSDPREATAQEREKQGLREKKDRWIEANETRRSRNLQITPATRIRVGTSESLQFLNCLLNYSASLIFYTVGKNGVFDPAKNRASDIDREHRGLRDGAVLWKGFFDDPSDISTYHRYLDIFSKPVVFVFVFVFVCACVCV